MANVNWLIIPEIDKCHLVCLRTHFTDIIKKLTFTIFEFILPNYHLSLCSTVEEDV